MLLKRLWNVFALRSEEHFSHHLQKLDSNSCGVGGVYLLIHYYWLFNLSVSKLPFVLIFSRDNVAALFWILHYFVVQLSDASVSSSMIRYKLASVVVHSGLSAESGHYYCYAKKSEDGIERWCLFNDSHVSLTTFQSLNNLTDQFSRDTAYVLFYARADLDLATADDKELIEKTLRQKIEDDNLAFEKVIYTSYSLTDTLKTIELKWILVSVAHSQTPSCFGCRYIFP